ncbi:MAG TPA: ATP-binding protein [Chitinophagaceae bacterium]
MRNSFPFLIIVLWYGSLQAQVLMSRDSLLKLLPSAKDDINTVELYINIGQQYESNEPEIAKQYYRMARDVSQKIDYTLGKIKYITNYTFVLNMQGYYDSSLALNLQSVELSRQIKDSQYLTKTLFNTGTSYRLKEEYGNAVRYYEEGKKLFEKFGNKAMEAQANDILQNMYTGMKQYRKAVSYGKKAIVGLKDINNPGMLGMAYNNLGLNYVYLQQFDSANASFKEALRIAKKIGDQNMEATQYLNMGDVLLQQSEFNAIKPYMDKALAISKKLKLYESETIALKGLSFYFQYNKNYPLAQDYADSALSLANRFDFRNERQKLFTHLSNLAYSMQDMELGEYYAKQNSLLEDSILNETIQKGTLELEKKYESKKKETHINQLEAVKKVQQLSIKQKNSLNYILIGAAATLLAITLLSYRNYKQKQKLQQQRINELETEKQLTATSAVLKGEEQERTRLAKDLHDGLGGMLSGIKYSLNTMKGNLIMTPDNVQAFERSMDMLDSSIKEMRRVAHNMMPEALVKFGLDTALEDFCNDINQSGAVQVDYQSIGMANVIVDQTTAITIYRIVQELLNNTLKHAAAKTAIVQLTKSDGHLSVTVEDDGKGFDTSILDQSKGIGWINIQNRVEFLQGKLDVQSEIEKGTSVHIEISV